MFYDPKKPPPVRLPGDDGPNPWDSATHPKDYPPRDWQIVGRGFGWWFGVIGAGVVYGLFAYFNSMGQ